MYGGLRCSTLCHVRVMTYVRWVGPDVVHYMSCESHHLCTGG